MTASAGLSPILVKVETLGQVEEGESQAPAPPVSVQPQTAVVTAAPAALIGGNLRSLSATSSCLISALEVTGLGFGSLAARPPRQSCLRQVPLPPRAHTALGRPLSVPRLLVCLDAWLLGVSCPGSLPAPVAALLRADTPVLAAGMPVAPSRPVHAGVLGGDSFCLSH